MLPVGSKETAKVHIHNFSGQDLEIEDVKISCSCLEVDRTSFIIPARSESAVEVRVTSEMEGTAENRLLIVPKDPELDRIIVPVRHGGVLAAKIVPSLLDMGEFPVGIPGERTFALRVENIPHREVTWQRASVDPKLVWLKAESVSPNVSEDGSFELCLRHDGAAPKGRYQGDIEITGTFGSESRSFVVHSVVTVADPLKIRPKSLLLKPPYTAHQDRTITLTSIAGPVDIESLSADPPILQLGVAVSSKDGRELLISVAPTEAPKETPFRARVSISIRNPVVEQIDLPVFFTDE